MQKFLLLIKTIFSCPQKELAPVAEVCVHQKVYYSSPANDQAPVPVGNTILVVGLGLFTPRLVCMYAVTKDLREGENSRRSHNEWGHICEHLDLPGDRERVGNVLRLFCA
jgi:hypothetical protein